MNDKLGDYCKSFERNYNSLRIVPGLPLYVRLDGRSFHTFTKGMLKPFDPKLISAMRNVAKGLVDEWDCKLAYVQSDEISLIFDDYAYLDAFPFFNGKITKLLSVLASSTTAKFSDETASWRLDRERWDGIPSPQFDCRIWQAPRHYAEKYLIWRQDDAIRSSVNMMAYEYLPPILQEANIRDKKEMLKSLGHEWESIPIPRQRGSFYGKRDFIKTYTPEQLSLLPPLHNARNNPLLEISRREVTELCLPPIRSIKNLTEVIFEDAHVDQENG